MNINKAKWLTRLIALNLLIMAVPAFAREDYMLGIGLAATIGVLELHIQILRVYTGHIKILSDRLAKLQSIAVWPEPYYPSPDEEKKDA